MFLKFIKILFLFIIFFAVLLPLVSQEQNTAPDEEEGYTVAGFVHFPKKGNVLMIIFDEEYNKDETKGIGIKTELIVGETELKEKKIAFEFKGLPAGRYAIKAFQDVDGSLEMNTVFGIPSEPWGLYKFAFPPTFKKMSFEVTQDILDIEFKVK